MIQFLKPAGIMSILALGAILGCATYYLWPHEPSVLIAPILSMIGVCALTFLKHHSHPYAAVFVLCFAVFFGWSQWQAQNAKYVPLPENLSDKHLWVVGQIVKKQSNDRRDRVLLHHAKIYSTNEQKLPTRVRLSTQKGRFEEHKIGDWVAVQAQLFSPNAPSFKGDFDARWYAFHRAYEASGIVMGSIYETYIEGSIKQKPWLMQFRHKIASLLNPDQTPEGALSAALMTGLKDAVPEGVQQNFRDAGLAHLLAISGMHLAMVGGLIYMLSRAVLAHTALATYYNIKHFSAVIGLLTSFVYMFLAGATIPTIRAFIMLGLLFVAVLLGRLRLGVRVICFGVCIVLAIWPHSVLSASFQMSFMAALALIFWSFQREKVDASHVGLVRRFDYFRHIWAASVVAGLATMPLASAHFQHVSLVGFLLNLVAIPLLGILLLPLTLLSIVTLGVEPVLSVLHFVSGGMIAWAEFGASFMGAGIYAPHWPILLVLAIISLGAYCLSRWRGFWLSTVLLVITLFIWPHSARFDMAWQKHGKTLAVQGDGALFVASSVGEYEDKYYISKLVDRFNLTVNKEMPMCDQTACFFELEGQKILIMRTQPPSAEDCYMVDWVISPYPPVKTCQNKIINLPESGFLNFVKGGYEIEPYKALKTRPWHKS